MNDREKKIAEIREALEKIDRGDLFEIAMAHEKSVEWLRFLLDELERLERLNEILQEEIQRLRASLEMAQSELRWGDYENAIERVERIIDEALSTATEPINAAKVKRIECPCCGCEISINAPEGDGNDA